MVGGRVSTHQHGDVLELARFLRFTHDALASTNASPAAPSISVPNTIQPQALADAARNGDQLALFETPLHLERLQHQSLILIRKQASGDRAAHLFADECHQPDLFGRYRDLGHLPPDVQRKVVCDNVCRLYDIDASKLPRVLKKAA